MATARRSILSGQPGVTASRSSTLRTAYRSIPRARSLWGCPACQPRDRRRAPALQPAWRALAVRTAAAAAQLDAARLRRGQRRTVSTLLPTRVATSTAPIPSPGIAGPAAARARRHGRR
jgi:hypothetical protein